MIRLPGNDKALTQETLYDDTLITCRSKPGTVDDADKSIPFSLMQSSPVAGCSSSADAVNKVATISNFPEFTLVNGREVVVYFANGNTATNPSMNINGTGAIAMDGSYWNAGTFMLLKYVDITVSGNRIQKWIVDQGAYNTKAQLNGALTNKLDWKRKENSFMAGIPVTDWNEMNVICRFGSNLIYNFQFFITYKDVENFTSRRFIQGAYASANDNHVVVIEVTPTGVGGVLWKYNGNDVTSNSRIEISYR